MNTSTTRMREEDNRGYASHRECQCCGQIGSLSFHCTSQGPVKSSRGFTLVEMLVTISISTIVMLAMTYSIQQLYKTNAYTIGQAYEIASASRGLSLLVRDLREMTYGDDGTYPLVYANANDIRFYSDIDRDDSVELVRYYLATTTLYKTITNPVGSPPVYGSTPDEIHTISEYVRNGLQATSTFLYYQSDGTFAATSTITDIRFVGVRLIVNIDPTSNPGEFRLESSATLRNLKTNF